MGYYRKTQDDASFQGHQDQGIAHQELLYRKEAAVKAFSVTLDLAERAATEFGENIVKAKVIELVGIVGSVTYASEKNFKPLESHVYRLHCHATPDVLNSYKVWTDTSPVNSEAVVCELSAALNVICHACSTSSGKVDFRRAFHCQDFAKFEEAVCVVQKMDTSSLKSEDVKLAFSLNLYRMMFSYALIKVGVPEAVDRAQFMSKVKFELSGYSFSLQEWVDGVLRGNTRKNHVAKTPFNYIDRRRKFTLRKLDHRIHFAIISDSTSCSSYSLPFRVFTADKVQKQLDIATTVFCNDRMNVSVKLKSQEVRLSKVFALNRPDFAKKDAKLAAFAAKHLQVTAAVSMRKALEDGFTIRFTEADWTTNAVKNLTFSKDKIATEVGALKAIIRRFQPPKTPENEVHRLEALRSFNLLDTLYEERFDRITRMAKAAFDVPFVFITLVDANRQWFKSVQWSCPLPQPTETGRDISFCGHAIHGDEGDVLFIENALEDDRFADNPLVTGDLAIRFYAGAPLAVPAGKKGGPPLIIGTLCIIDLKPRSMDEEQVEKLRHYASQVRDEILRRDDDEARMMFL